MKVTYEDHMGDDLMVVNCARVSFDKRSDCHYGGGEKWLSDVDTSLIKFLARGCTKEDYLEILDSLSNVDWSYEHEVVQMRHILDHWRKTPKHWVPFANGGTILLHFKVPIFVARQLQKHQAGFEPQSEISRRYVTSEPELYEPKMWRKAADNVKQGSSDVRMDIDKAFRKLNGPTKNSRRSPCAVKFANWKARAKREGTEFSISIEDVPWETSCPIMGMELDYTLCDDRGIKANSPTLDRIDSGKGYTKDNIQVISWLANSMKNCATQDELMSFIKGAALRHGGGMVTTVGDYNQKCLDLYNAIIEEGGCAEQARMVLPQSMYTEYYWKGNLYAWASLYNTRMDPHTQKETRDVVKQIGDIIKPLFPVSWRALVEGDY